MLNRWVRLVELNGPWRGHLYESQLLQNAGTNRRMVGHRGLIPFLNGLNFVEFVLARLGWKIFERLFQTPLHTKAADAWQWLTVRPSLACIVTGSAPMMPGLALLPMFLVLQLVIGDEFSPLLVADRFLHAWLTNPVWCTISTAGQTRKGVKDHQESKSVEWVYNTADIDGQRVVWARDRGPERNEDQDRYNKGRAFWVLDADDTPAVAPVTAFAGARGR